MNEKKFSIEKNTVEETLIIPLYARKLSTEIYPNLFEDKGSMELIEKIDYDFSKLESKSKSLMYRFGALEIAMRQSDLAIEIKEYLRNHPKAAIVNLGCGLDQTGENCDNGLCTIYNIDYDNVIKIRNRLLGERERVINISADLNDRIWFELIDSSNGVVFFASGVFYYFKTEDIKSLFLNMEKRFSNGVLIFDMAGKKAVKLMIKTWLKQAGITKLEDFFYVDSLDDELIPWLKNTKVSSRGYMLGYNDLKDKSISRIFRLFSKYCDNRLNMQIIKLEFK